MSSLHVRQRRQAEDCRSTPDCLDGMSVVTLLLMAVFLSKRFLSMAETGERGVEKLCLSSAE
jgi:hypothetical protein